MTEKQHCDYCNGWVSIDEIKNGLCPNCSAPINTNQNDVLHLFQRELFARELCLQNTVLVNMLKQAENIRVLK